MWKGETEGALRGNLRGFQRRKTWEGRGLEEEGKVTWGKGPEGDKAGKTNQQFSKLFS